AADSYVGFARQGSDGIWAVAGTEHVTNANAFGQTATIRGRGDKPVTGVVRFNIFREAGQGCDDDGPKRYARAYRFEGRMRVERVSGAPNGPTGHCDTAAGHRKLNRNTSAFTGTSQSLKYDHSFTLVGLTLGSSTTFGSNAQIELRNRSKHAIWICGMSTS